MTETGERALLPAGLQDLLAPEAAQEAGLVERLLGCFAASGYERVKPPLMEFEEALFAGAGAAVAQQSFRLMDPVSHRMMALRADITPQVARIASTRLRRAPRPLRICYGGQVLRVKGTQLRPERQFAQAGVELIGAPQAEADAEVVLLAAEALTVVGIGELSVDLNQPTLVAAIASGLDFDAARSRDLRAALDRKDAAAVAVAAGEYDGLFQDLVRASGPAEGALAALAGLSLPQQAAPELARLREVAKLVEAAAPELTVTIDPVEHRGFEYQTGVSFTIFARGVRGELGRGGRYVTELPDGDSESSTGFTLYLDTLLRALPPAEQAARVYLPPEAGPETARALRAEGWVTVAGFEAGDAEELARQLRCSHYWCDQQIHKLGD